MLRSLLPVLALSMAVVAPSVARAQNDPVPSIITDPVPPIAGPRRTIAVGQIDTLGPLSNSSGTSVGGSVAAMLTTALSQSDRFIVVERNALGQIVTEQELATNRVSTGTAAPRPGSVIPAQYIVVGSVTEYSTADSGTNASGSRNGVGVGAFGLGLSLGRSKGRVAIDFRVVDTRTGSVVHSFSVRQKLRSTNIGISGGRNGISIGAGQFWNTPLGDATRRALNEAVIEIAKAVDQGRWQGQVVERDGATVYVNAGGEAGLRVGDRLAIQRPGRTFTDPSTGQVLSQRMEEVGTVTIASVEPKLAYGPFTPAGTVEPTRGDLVVADD